MNKTKNWKHLNLGDELGSTMVGRNHSETSILCGSSIVKNHNNAPSKTYFEVGRFTIITKQRMD